MEKKKKRQEIFGAFWSNLEIRDSDGNLLESIDIEDETVDIISKFIDKSYSVKITRLYE